MLCSDEEAIFFFEDFDSHLYHDEQIDKAASIIPGKRFVLDQVPVLVLELVLIHFRWLGKSLKVRIFFEIRIILLKGSFNLLKVKESKGDRIVRRPRILENKNARTKLTRSTFSVLRAVECFV